MNEVFDIPLLGEYLKRIQTLTSSYFDKALNGSITSDESKAVQELSQTCHVITAIYFYRKKEDINELFRRVPMHQRRHLETPLRIIWIHLEGMSANEITDLSIETIHRSTKLEGELNND